MTALLALLRAWPPLAALLGASALVLSGMASAAVLVPLALLLRDPGASNTPPPPYTSGQVNLATVNALGGVGATMSCSEAVTTTERDLLATARWTANSCDTSLLTIGNATLSRIYTVKLLAAGAANSRVCVGVSPTAPVICTDANVAGDGYGCSLVNAGDVCQWTIRPQLAGCTSWDNCHAQLWEKGSASVGAAAIIEVAVAQ